MINKWKDIIAEAKKMKEESKTFRQWWDEQTITEKKHIIKIGLIYLVMGVLGALIIYEIVMIVKLVS
jgi:hypothetical protein